MFKFQEESKNAAKKLGYSQNLSWLGEGEFGAVYEIENTNKAIKITTDEDEIITACKLLNKNTDYFVHIYNIEKINNHEYAIIMDKIETKGVPQLFEVILKEAEQQMCHYLEVDLEKTFYNVPEEAKNLIEVLKDANIEAKNIGFVNNDIHINNIGKKKNGDFVVFDQHSGFSKLQIQNELNKIFNKAKKIKP